MNQETLDTTQLVQGSKEWLAARCGSLGAASINDIMARTKTGFSASRANVMARMIAERLTGMPQDGYKSPAMMHGTATEPDARAAYEFMTDATVTQVGLVLHPTIKGTHASPDGLVGDDGLMEIKCPQTATHIETLSTETIDTKHIRQMQWQMACTGRDWCDFVSYDPRLPESMSIFIKRVSRDDALINEMEECVTAFLEELDTKIKSIKDKFDPALAAE
jgi:putative phage-type endonuclease